MSSLYKTIKINTQIFILSLVLNATLMANQLQIEGLDGKQHYMSEFIGNGKWTVLNIWGAECPPCREEMPDLVQFHDIHNDDDAIVIGIAIDFPSYGYAKKNEVRQFSEDYFIDFPLLLSDSSITNKLGLGRLDALPTTYIYTPNGKLVGKQIGVITKDILEKFIKKYNFK